MKLTKEQEIEQACIAFCYKMCTTTLEMINSNKNLPPEHISSFSTGVLCIVDRIGDDLLPTLRKIVKENPKSFENLN